MTNFQLTPNQKHYVNAAGERCECAFLNGVWVASWGEKHMNHVTTHAADGSVISGHLPEWAITAQFEDWLSDPFEGAPEWVRFATACNAKNPNAVLWARRPEPTDFRFAWGSLHEDEKSQLNPDAVYIGDWRNSLIKRGEWE